MLIAAVLVMVVWIPGAARGEDGFFNPPTDPYGDRAPDRIYPRGRIFPFTAYGLGMRATAETPLTLAGRMYRFSPDDLTEAAEHDTPVVGGISGGWSKDDLRAVSRDEIVAALEAEVRAVLAHPHQDRLAWWYLKPEELRYWREHEIDYLELAADTIRRVDPHDRPVWMYDPGHRNAEALSHTARHLDIVGKGMYTNYSGQVRDRVWVRWTIEQQKRAIAAANPDAIPIAVPEMFRHPGQFIDAYRADASAAAAAARRWVRHDVYAALISGARGLAVFAWIPRPGDPARGRLPFKGAVYQAYRAAYLRVAEELTGTLNLGAVFLFGRWRDDLTVSITEGPRTLTLEYRPKHNEPAEYPTVGHATIDWRDGRYLFLVNSAERAVTARVRGLPIGEELTVHDLFGANTFNPTTGAFDLRFDRHEVKAFRIAPPDGR